MERTINGKSMKAVLEELKKPFEECVITQKGQSAPQYITITKEWYDERLDEVLGLNYNFVITGKPWAEIIGSMRYISVQGYISIIDDVGVEVVSRHAIGTANVIITNAELEDNGIEESTPVSYPNAYKTALADLKKKCAKELGVSRDISLDKFRIEKKNQIMAYKSLDLSSIYSKKTSTSSNKTQEEFNIEFKSSFKQEGKLYKADCVNISTGEKLKLVVFANKKESLSEKEWNYFINTDNTGKPCAFIGKSSKYKSENQIVFYEFVKNKKTKK